MKNVDWNSLRDRAYKISCDHGFHEEKASKKEIKTYLMLIITEVSEAVEADRKCRHADTEFFNRKYKDCSDTRFGYERTIMGSVEEELADIIIRCLDAAGAYNLDIDYSTGKYTFAIDGKSFVENAFSLSDILINLYFESALKNTINYVLDWCEYLDIDIMAHIELKMKYNETRPYKNGKKY